MRISDWSSDVCSSDLVAARHKSLARAAEELAVTPAAIHHQVKLLEENLGVSLFIRSGNNLDLTQAATAILPTLAGAIGRASCRERGCKYVTISVVAVSIKEKRQRS